VVAFFTSLLVAILLVAPIFPYAKRRPVGTPITWGEAILAGTYVFFILFWIYGVVPHQFLTWADSELSWRPDRVWLGPNGVMVVPFTGWTLQTPWFPVQVSAQAVRDIVAVGLYVVLLGLQMWMWAWWQKRGQRAEAAATAEPVSTYGRPLMKRA